MFIQIFFVGRIRLFRERERQRETERDRVTKGKEFEEFSFRTEEGKSYGNCLRLKRLARATTLFIIYVPM